MLELKLHLNPPLSLSYEQDVVQQLLRSMPKDLLLAMHKVCVNATMDETNINSDVLLGANPSGTAQRSVKALRGRPIMPTASLL